MIEGNINDTVVPMWASCKTCKFRPTCWLDAIGEWCEAWEEKDGREEN